MVSSPIAGSERNDLLMLPDDDKAAQRASKVFGKGTRFRAQSFMKPKIGKARRDHIPVSYADFIQVVGKKRAQKADKRMVEELKFLEMKRARRK